MNLVYLSPLPWASFAQRPHKFVEWFHARYGGEVLWVDPYPTRLPRINDFTLKKFTITRSNISSLKRPQWLQVISPCALPIEPIIGLSLLNRFLWSDLCSRVDKFITKSDDLIGIGKPSALALQILLRYQKHQSFYDSMDDFPAFHQGLSRKSVIRCERRVVEKVSKIIVSSTSLYKKYDYCKSKVLIAFNACASEMLPNNRKILTSNARPILGYVGTIGHWFDWTLVINLAIVNPMILFRLIGPVHNPPPLKIPSNIEFLSECDHETALVAMQDFSVGLIPFKQSDLTASVDPIKYYEYRAMGLPIISSYFGEMISRKNQSGVFLVESKSNFQEIILQALSYKPHAQEIQEFRQQNSWKSRFDACKIF